MSKIQNAKIESTMLGYEDHGILTAYVMLSGDGWGVGFGGYGFDGYDKELKKRRAMNGYGLEFIRRVLEVAGVQSWEKLPGCYVRVDSEGFGGRALRIGHITKDLWFDPAALTEEFKRETADVG